MLPPTPKLHFDHMHIEVARENQPADSRQPFETSACAITHFKNSAGAAIYRYRNLAFPLRATGAP